MFIVAAGNPRPLALNDSPDGGGYKGKGKGKLGA